MLVRIQTSGVCFPLSRLDGSTHVSEDVCVCVCFFFFGYGIDFWLDTNCGGGGRG